MEKQLSVAELESKLKDADTLEQYKRCQVILVRTKNPDMSVREVASLCQIAYKTVTQWTWIYNKGGAEQLILSGRGDRHPCIDSVSPYCHGSFKENFE